MNNELLNRDALIQAVAMKYGIIITKNDPMLVLLALHHEILGQYQEVMQQSLDAWQFNLKETHDQHLKQIKADAATYVGQVLNEALRVTTQADTATRDGVAVEMEKQRKLLVAAMDDNVGMMQKWMWVSLGAAGGALLGFLLTALLIAWGS